MIKDLEEAIGYRFQNITLLQNALTHSSYANERWHNSLLSNERLEFLGIRQPVIKAHGSSDARAFRNAVRQAMDAAKNNISEELEQNLHLLSQLKETSHD